MSEQEPQGIDYGYFPYPVLRIVEHLGGVPKSLSLEMLTTPGYIEIRGFVEAGLSCSIDDLPIIFNPDKFLSNVGEYIVNHPEVGWTNYARLTREEWLRGSVINAIDGINQEWVLPTASQLAPGDLSGRHSAPILRVAECVASTRSKPQTYIQTNKNCSECPLAETGCSVTLLQESRQRVLIQEILEKLGIVNIPPEARRTLEKLLELQETMEGVPGDKNLIEDTITKFEYRARVSELDFRLQAHDANKLTAQGNRLGIEIINRVRNRTEYTEYSGYESDTLVLSKDLYLKLTHVTQALILLIGRYDCQEFVTYLRTIYQQLDSKIEEMDVLGMVGIQRSIVRELFDLPQIVRNDDLAEDIKKFVDSMQFIDRNSRRPVTAALEITGNCKCVYDSGVVSRALLNILSDVANHGRRNSDGVIEARVGIHKIRVGEEDFVELSVTNPGFLDKAALKKIGRVIYSRHDGRGHGNGKVSISNLFERFYSQMGYPSEFIESTLQAQWSLIDESGEVVADPGQVDKNSTSLRWRILLPVSIHSEP